MSPKEQLQSKYNDPGKHLRGSVLMLEIVLAVALLVVVIWAMVHDMYLEAFLFVVAYLFLSLILMGMRALAKIADDVAQIRRNTQQSAATVSGTAAAQAPVRPAVAGGAVEGGWRCTCGRMHSDVIATCTCGRNKRDVLNGTQNQNG